MTELVPANIDGRLAYANALSQAKLLPETFRGRPADVLVAMDWGESLGLTPMQAMQSIYVVHGRPGLSSQAKQALAGKAGHRIRVQGDTQAATAKLWRADDPEFPYESTWTIDMARSAGLIKKDSAWQSYPHVMLRRRAVSDVVEQACPELLLGLSTADVDTEWPDQPAPTVTITRADDTQVDTSTGEIIEPVDLDEITAVIGTADVEQLRALWRQYHAHPQWPDISALIETRNAQLSEAEAPDA